MGDWLPMEKRRVKSLKHIFLGYLVRFTITVILTFVVLNVITMAALGVGLLYPANYVENLIHDHEKYMQEFDSYEWIPNVCDYVVCDSEGKIKEYSGTLENSELAIEDYRKGLSSRNLKYYYAFVYQDEICIVSYPVRMCYNSQYLNRILPSPLIVGVLVFFILFVVEVMILASRYTKRMARELQIVKQATENIKMNQLEFRHDMTQIREMNEVLDSLDHMKQELSESLKNQWKLEEMRKLQIQALAHDIKTPLTVLFGNADLLEETDLDEEQQSYYSKIIMSAQDMETYLNRLLDISRSEKKESLSFTSVALNPFLEEVKRDSQVLVQNKEIQLEIVNDCQDESMTADANSLKRILMNLVGNSVEYTQRGGRIRIWIRRQEAKQAVVIQVEDSGRGFTEQELKNATEQFYQGEESRSSKHHYGLGLAIVKNLVEGHNGTLELSNSDELGGAKVTIQIPWKE